MSLYHYKALNTENQVLRGSLSAPDRNQLELILKGQHKELISATKIPQWKGLQKQTAPHEVTEFFIQFKSLHRAKLPLLDILQTIQEALSPSTLKQALEDSLIALDNGTDLSTCFSNYPRLFDSITLSLLQAGEETGQISQALDHIIDHLKWQQDFKLKSKKALTYPACLVAVIGGVIALLFTTLVPQLTTFFQTMGIELPVLTQLLIAVSAFVASSWETLLISGLFLGAIIFISGRLSHQIALFWNRMLLKLPFWGRLKLSVSLMRYFHVLWILLASHVELLKSLKTAQTVFKNKSLQHDFVQVYEDIQQGKSLSQALSSQSHIPPFVIRILRIGEQSGDLVESLQNVNYFFDRDVDQKTTKLLKLLEPTLVLILGCIVAWIALAIFYPLYDSLTVLEM